MKILKKKFQSPSLHTPLTLKRAVTRSGTILSVDRLCFERPYTIIITITFRELLKRLRYAWRVFVGRYDVVDWGEDMESEA